MTEQANSEANPTTEDPTPDKPTYEELIAQNKGLQRANQRYRDDLAAGIKNDGISKEVELSRNTTNELIDLIKDSPLLDPDTVEKIEAIKDKSARVQSDLAEETALRSEIAVTLGNANIDYDDDTPEMEVLRTHYEAGNVNKVRELLTEIKSKTSTNNDVEAMVEARLQAKLKERGLPVDTGDSAHTGTPPAGKDGILGGLDKGDLSPAEALRQAIALADST
jgi:hypothetical protein